MIRFLILGVMLAGCSASVEITSKANPRTGVCLAIEHAAANGVWTQSAGIDRNDAVVRQRAFQSTVEAVDATAKAAASAAAEAKAETAGLREAIEAVAKAPKPMPVSLDPVNDRIAGLEKRFDDLVVKLSGDSRDIDLRIEELQKIAQARAVVESVSVAFPGRPDRVLFFHRAGCVHCVTVETKEFPKLRPAFVITEADTAHVQSIDWDSLIGKQYRDALGAPDDPAFPLFLRVVDGKIRKSVAGYLPADKIAELAKEKPADLKPAAAKPAKST